jgi:hypothetical protein
LLKRLKAYARPLVKQPAGCDVKILQILDMQEDSLACVKSLAPASATSECRKAFLDFAR